jgi:transcriptional regulator with XRE-family HTH domain
MSLTSKKRGLAVANDALRHAMSDAKKTERDLASACRVDVKTVARWLSDEGRLPHPRHRWAASDVLGVDETVLWPEALRTTVKTGPDREIVAAYPFRSTCPNGVWRGLIHSAEKELVFAGYTCYFLWLEQSNLRTLLRRRADAGCRIRFLLGDPQSAVTRRREDEEKVALTISVRIKVTLDELERLRDVENIEARFSDEHVSMSLFQFDQEMLITPHLARLVGHESPMLHLRRRQQDGLFDRFAYHLTELWESGRPVFT